MLFNKGMWLGALLATGLAWSGVGMAAEAGQGITGPEMVRILQDAGYRAKLDTDDEGDPTIETRMSGVTVHVYFYDCEKARCGSLQFALGLDLEQGSTLAKINAFNRNFRYVRASLDDEMDPFLQFDFEVLHAARTAHIVSQVDLWEDLLGEFLKATGYRTSDSPAAEAASADACCGDRLHAVRR